jgi:hypothetical protein
MQFGQNFRGVTHLYPKSNKGMTQLGIINAEFINIQNFILGFSMATTAYAKG